MSIQLCKRHVVFAHKITDEGLENLSNLCCSDKTKRLYERFDDRLYKVSDRNIYTTFHHA